MRIVRVQGRKVWEWFVLWVSREASHILASLKLRHGCPEYRFPFESLLVIGPWFLVRVEVFELPQAWLPATSVRGMNHEFNAPNSGMLFLDD